MTDRTKNDKYLRISAIYNSSVIQDFDSFLKTEIDLIEDDIGLVSDEYISSFMTYELEPGVYSLFDFLANFVQKENVCNHSIKIEVDDITMKPKLVVGSGNIALRLESKSFFNSIFGFNTLWDFKNYNEYISQKITNLSTIKKVHLK